MIKFRKELNKINTYVPGKPIEELKREYGIKNIIKLASNENPLGTSPKALKVLEKEYKNVFLYPDDSNYYLIKRIVGKNKCKSDNIIMGNGSVELLNQIIQVSCNKGDLLIRSDPSFIMPYISAKLIGVKVKNIKLKKFKHNIERIVKCSKKHSPKIVYIDNPTNPIGTMLNKDEIEYLLKNISSNTIIILDEAYNEYIDENKRINSIKLMKKYKNLIILRTFSKIYGLAGLRVGYLIADKYITQYVKKLRLPFNVNLLAQKTALAAIDDNEFIKKSKNINDKEKVFLYRELNKLGYQTIESFTNFISLDSRKDTKILFDKLLSKGVIVRPLNAYKLPTFIRISIGTHSQNVKFIKAFKEVINEI